MINATEVKTQVTISTVGPLFWSPPGGTGRIVDCDMVKKLGRMKWHALLNSYEEGLLQREMLNREKARMIKP